MFLVTLSLHFVSSQTPPLLFQFISIGNVFVPRRLQDWNVNNAPLRRICKTFERDCHMIEAFDILFFLLLKPISRVFC